MTPELARERAHLAADEMRERLLQRVAVLSQYVDRLLAALAKGGVRAPAAPNLDDVRPAILAEGMALRMKLQAAELRIADDEIKTLQREKADLRRRLEAIERGGDSPATTASTSAATGALVVAGGEFPPRRVHVGAETSACRRCETCDAPIADADPEVVYCRSCIELAPTDAPPAPPEDEPAAAPTADDHAIEAAADSHEAGDSPTDSHQQPDAPATPPAKRAVVAPLAMLDGKKRPRTKEGWFYHALKALGTEATAIEVAAADQRNASSGIAAAQDAVRGGLVEVCGKRGLQNVYRIKAGA